MNQENKLKLVNKYINGKMPINILIIPFSYQNEVSYEKTLDKLMEEGGELQWEFTSLASEDNELFEHIYQLIGSNIPNSKTNNCNNEMQSNCIGNCLELIQFKTSIPHLNGKGWIEIYEGSDKVGAYRIKNVKIAMFKTGIGFLIINIAYQKSITIMQIAKLNNVIKSTKSSKYIFCYNSELEFDLNQIDILDIKPENTCSHIKVKYNNQIKYIPINNISSDICIVPNSSIAHQLFSQGNQKFRLKYKTEYPFEKLIDTLLTGINIITFFNNVYSNPGNKLYPKKAHVFSSVLVENDGWDQKEYESAFFYLRKGYKDTYHPSESEFNIENNTEIQKPFNNSYWGISREGCANLCHLTENDTTNAFFRGNYADRIDNYIYIYIIALHQYYGLLNITRKTTGLSSTVSIYANNDLEFGKIILLRDEINFFYLKCIYEEISHITHQAKLYSMMVEEFGIRRMLSELHFEMDRIIGIIAQIRESDDKKRREMLDEHQKKLDKKRKNNLMIISIAGGLFTFIQTFDSSFQIWNDIANQWTIFKGFELVNAVLTVIGAVVFGSIIWGIWRTIDKKKSKNIK